MERPLAILVVDDAPDLREILEEVLRGAGHNVTTAADGAQALALFSARSFDVVLCDVRLPLVDGLTLLRRLRRDAPATDVILLTAYGAIADAVTALREGACDYLTKPFAAEEITMRMARIAEQRALRRELDDARARLAAQAGPIIGSSPAMARLRERIETIAQSDAPVLITGESGTGKELAARMLHDASPRRGKPFVAVNCAAFPESLIEAELFGHERGAFTGAMRRRDGRFKAADGGTLLLDEVAELPLSSQAKLLRVLQEGRIEPLGGNQSIAVDVRVISATHRNLTEWIAQGRFREDLYFRLMVLDIDIPPLRQRRGDLPLLMQYFLQRFTPAGREVPTLTPAALAALAHYRFPGNVRELGHAVQHAIVLARDGTQLDVGHLPPQIRGEHAEDAAAAGGELRTLSAAVREFEREYLTRALARADGHRARAAEVLGISRKTLWEKMRALGMLDGDADD